MRRNIVKIAFACLIGFFLPAFASNPKLEYNPGAQKYYVTPDNIAFVGKEIYVLIGQEWRITDAVYADQNGLYIDEKGGWTCSYCHHWNEGNLWTCDSCGKARQ